nr:Hsp70 family protein [Mycolicibacterium moriokaense]
MTAELPGHRSTVAVTRTELESLISAPLDGVLAALQDTLERNRIGWADIAAVVVVGGGAGIPSITQRLSQHPAPIVLTPQPGLDAAAGAALFAAYGSAAEAQTDRSRSCRGRHQRGAGRRCAADADGHCAGVVAGRHRRR